MNGTADIVRDFVASCRAQDVSPCLYFIPSMDAFESQDTPTTYLAKQLEMLRELLTRYGHIDRIWFDYWGSPPTSCSLAAQPGTFPKGWANITSLVNELSPTTAFVPGQSHHVFGQISYSCS